MKIRAARISRSKRLQRVMRFWADRRWHSTRETIRRAHVCAVNSIAAELRANGCKIECKRAAGIWRYRWS